MNVFRDTAVMSVCLKWMPIPFDLPLASTHLAEQPFHEEFKPSESNVKTSIKWPLGEDSSQWLEEIRKKKRLACKFPFHAEINLLTYLQEHKAKLKESCSCQSWSQALKDFPFQFPVFPRSLAYSIQKRQVTHGISKFSTFLLTELLKMWFTEEDDSCSDKKSGKDLMISQWAGPCMKTKISSLQTSWEESKSRC